MSFFAVRTILFCLLLYVGNVDAVIIASAVEVHVSIEDGNMHQPVIIDAKFDGENVDISQKSFMNRKVTKVFNISPGQYQIEWTTEKSEKPWGEAKKELKKHRRTIIIELTDAVVYINIRGEALTTY